MKNSFKTKLLQSIRASFFREFGSSDVDMIRQLSRSGNSQVYQLQSGEISYVLKAFEPNAEGERRMDHEVEALMFFGRHGIEQVPQLVASDRASHLLLLSYIEGSAHAGQWDESDMEQLCAFLQTLHKASRLPEAGKLPDASDSCMSLGDIMESIDERYHRLVSTSADKRVQSFLRDSFRSVYDTCISTFEKQAQTLRISRAEQTLSPSDFGFHNAICTSSGQWYFVDFEHFGWDDPAKLIIDTIIHPQLCLSDAMRQLFLTRCYQIYDQINLPKRLRMYYPFLALKWCLIFLNEFLPEGKHRRQFAGRTTDESALERQLESAAHMLTTAERGLEEFPYAVQ